MDFIFWVSQSDKNTLTKDASEDQSIITIAESFYNVNYWSSNWLMSKSSPKNISDQKSKQILMMILQK